MMNQKLADFISARIAHLTYVIEVYVPGDEDEVAGYAEQLEQWQLELATYQAAQDRIAAPAPSAPDGWIKCSDRMPDVHGYYLTHSNAGVDVTLCAEGKFFDEYSTHWMPLPAAPGGE